MDVGELTAQPPSVGITRGISTHDERARRTSMHVKEQWELKRRSSMNSGGRSSCGVGSPVVYRGGPSQDGGSGWQQRFGPRGVDVYERLEERERESERERVDMLIGDHSIEIGKFLAGTQN